MYLLYTLQLCSNHREARLVFVSRSTLSVLKHCDLTAHTVLLYVLFCLTHMYCLSHVPCSAHHHRLLVFTLSQHTFTFTLSHSVIGLTILNTLSRVHPFHLCWATISIFGITSIKKSTSDLLFLTKTLRLPTTNIQHVFKKRYEEKHHRDRSPWPGADPVTERT